MIETPRTARRRLRAARRANDGSDWRWWTKLASVVLAAVVATVLILFGAVRFLAQAQEEHDRVECVRTQVQAQARGNSAMASAVLDAARSQAERAGAVAGWRDDQSRIADSIGRC